jgi:thiamine biosynthesis protein ThiI
MKSVMGWSVQVKYDSVIVRFGGEIGIKGEWTRRAYERLLLKNMKKAFEHHGLHYERFIRKRGRIYIKAKNGQEIASKLTRVFGVSSVSPALETTSDMNEIVQKTVALADTVLKDGSSFAVRCHRVGKHPYSSGDVCKEVGKQILEQFKNRNLQVNLKNPQFTVSVEVRDECAYAFAETLHGVGGFPLGSQPKVVCLLSGGIDSAVASWLVMKRGCPIVPLYFDIMRFTDETATVNALDVARKLFGWSIGFSRRVYVVPHGGNLEIFVRESPRKLTCILCKRMIYRVAERIAEMEKAEGIITGEAIGEQASQTLHNLRVLDEAAAKYPVHRPLLGFNKVETEELAKKIGTFEISTRKITGCGAVPARPATKAKLEIVKKAERELDIEGMADASARAAKIVTV